MSESDREQCPECGGSGCYYCHYTGQLPTFDHDVVQCILCDKLTTVMESRLRRFDEGRCGGCGGTLRLLNSPLNGFRTVPAEVQQGREEK